MHSPVMPDHPTWTGAAEFGKVVPALPAGPTWVRDRCSHGSRRSRVGRSRNRRYGLGGALSALLVTLAGCSVVANESEPEPVRIAADLQLTGDGSALGTVYRNALQLRVEQVNQLGLLGDRRLELEVHDNRSDPATSTANIERLAAEPDLAALITGGCGECVVSAVDAINTRGMPTIALAAPTNVSSPVGERPFLFKLGPNANHNAFALTAALAAADVETIGLVTTGDQYGEDGLAEMTDAAVRPNIEIVVHEQVGGGADLAAAAGRIAGHDPDSGILLDPDAEQLGPDAVVVWTSAALAGETAASLRDAGYDGPLYLDAGAAGDLFLAGASRDALAGATLVFTETLVMDEVVATSPAKAARKTWFRDYTAQFGTYHAYSSFAADAVALVVDGVNRAGGTDRAQLRDTIETTQLDGLTGQLRLTQSQHSALAARALTLVTVRGDRWRLGG
ncbi:MAG: ABC transporter substrate-binding protein [Micromonosporaceae bacterium]|nr:ABC transporter substrate-binding protein [Micromonosporaceae bacterium]